MSMLDRRKRLAGMFASFLVVSAVGTGCANAGDHARRATAAPGVVTGGPKPYMTMRPIFGWASPRPLYLSGYAGYNYSRMPGGPVETAYDGRYERDFPPHLFGGHRRGR